eukprot:3847946-Ditylum_brightwellii.AAC.1
MSNMWKKIKFSNKGSQDDNIKLIQIPATWPDTDVDISLQMQLEDPKFVEILKEILHYLTICNRCHFEQEMGTLFTVTLKVNTLIGLLIPSCLNLCFKENTQTMNLMISPNYS